jgi:probable F420-dependent oxidoreductase
MRFFFQYPDMNAPEPHLLDAGPVADVAAAVEAAGWDGFTFTEHPAPGARWLSSGGHQTLDPFIALGHAAAVTSRIELLTYLTVVPYRNPLLLAKSAATVDLLSGGRFILGVGTGYLKGEFRALGVDFDERNDLFDEALEVMPLHWSGEPFSYEGKHFAAKDTQARPAPVRQPIPIWIGGNAKITRRRVAERAQGWMPLGGPEEMFATTRTPGVGTLDDLGRLIAEVKDLAGDRADQLSFVYAYLDSSLSTSPTEDVERHRDRLGQMAEIGLTHTVSSCASTSLDATTDWIQTVGELYVRTG